MKRTVYLVAVLLAFTAWACGGTDDPTDDPQVANPASEYCVDQGGTSETRTDDEGGEYGVCVFADGSECDEWEYYRGECEPGADADGGGSGADDPDPPLSG